MHSDFPTRIQATPLQRLGGLFSLMRPVNTLVAFAGIAAACLIAGAEPGDWPRILLTALAGALAGAFGNVINDVYDVAIDRVNKPLRAIASGRVSPRTGSIWAAVCALAALLLSLPLGSAPALIVAASILLMYAYSAVLKRIPLVGNLAVGLLTGAAFIFGALVFGRPEAGIVPAVFAFLFNIAREILKDLEDVRGDRAQSIRTFPLVAGERAALLLVTLLLIVVIAASIVPAVTGMYHTVYFWVVFFGVDCVLAYVLFAVWNDRSTRSLGRLNTLLKYDMLAGIGAILLGSLLS